MKKNLFHIIILTAMLNFAGCGVFSSVADFTKQGYTNTVAYFNTYYNAQRLYNEAVSEMERTIAAAQEKPSNIPYSKIPLTPAARQKFSSSIEKNSKLLSYYPNSTWVDDALLMIGKSYIYLENNVKAERKFLELFAKYPNSDLIPEAKLFYGKALLNQKKEKEGVANLQALYEESQQNGDKTIAADAALSLGQYYAENKEYETAIPLLQASLKYSSDDAINAQTEMRIADCYAAMQNYKEAETAYRNVERYTPIYFQYFRSRIEMVKMVRAQKQFSDVLDLLNNLLSDAKNTEYAATIHFEIANTFLAMDSLNTAIEKFQYVDTAFVRTDEAARSYFVLANLFEKKFLLYDSAKALYDKAKAEFPQSDISAEAARKSDIFGKYASLWKDIVKNDSLYTRNDSAAITIDTLQLAKQFVAPPIDTVKEKGKKKESIAAQHKRIAKDSTQYVDSILTAAYEQKVKNKTVVSDSLLRQKVKLRFELAGLFYLEIQQPDSAIHWYNQVITNFPTSEFAPRSLFTLAELYSSTGRMKKEETDSLYRFLIDAYPASIYAQEARKFLNLPLLEKENDPAEELFLQAENTADTNSAQAITLYQQLSSRYQTSPLASKALYAAGWLYENTLVNNDSALSVYRRLIKQYPVSQFANLAKLKVTAYENEIKRKEDEAKQKAAEDEAKKKAAEEEAKKQREAKNRINELEQRDSLNIHHQPIESDTLSLPQH